MCEFCSAARQSPGLRIFDPKCLWCGARYFQALRTFPPITTNDRPETKDERQAWRARVVDTWVKQGHSRAELLELAKAEEIPYAPVTGRRKE